MESYWKTWEELALLSSHKKIVLYGRSEDWVPKIMRKIKLPVCIIDKNTIYEDTKYKGVDVVGPEDLLKMVRDDIYIIITSGVYEGIVKFLMDNGYMPGEDFCCSPEMKDYSLLEEIRNYEQEIIVSCSDYNDSNNMRYSRAGGGLYKYHIGPNNIELLVKGSFRQIISVESQIFAIEFVECKLYKFDENFNILEKYDLDSANYCGIDYCSKRNILILINAGLDTISIHDVNTFELIDRVDYSNKNKINGVTSQHHLNDVCVFEDYLYVSYFSHSGNWKINIHDGGISEINLNDIHETPRPVVTGLWKPHSPKIIQGALSYLDSMRGAFHTTDQAIAGKFDGFARGLAFDGRFYYIGQSEDMYMSKRFGTTNNIMLNAGFYLFDIHTKASRFYPMLDNMNIHDLMVMDKHLL
jgi:hypothetical protein